MLQVSGSGFRVACFVLRVSGCRVRVASYWFRVAGSYRCCGFWVADFWFYRFAGCERKGAGVKVSGCRFRVMGFPDD